MSKYVLEGDNIRRPDGQLQSVADTILDLNTICHCLHQVTMHATNGRMTNFYSDPAQIKSVIDSVNQEALDAARDEGGRK